MGGHGKVISLIFLLAVGIYGFRTYVNNSVSNRRVVLKVEDNKAVLEQQLFHKYVLEPHEETFNSSLIHLIVFANLKQDCPSYLFEAEEWFRPYQSYDPDIYKVTLFTPEGQDQEILESFKNYYQLADDDLIQYAKTSPLTAYQTGYVLKVCYTLPEGIKWVEMGTASIRGQENFRLRISQELETVTRLAFANPTEPEE